MVLKSVPIAGGVIRSGGLGRSYSSCKPLIYSSGCTTVLCSSSLTLKRCSWITFSRPQQCCFEYKTRYTELLKLVHHLEDGILRRIKPLHVILTPNSSKLFYVRRFAWVAYSSIKRSWYDLFLCLRLVWKQILPGCLEETQYRNSKPVTLTIRYPTSFTMFYKSAPDQNNASIYLLTLIKLTG